LNINLWTFVMSLRWLPRSAKTYSFYRSTCNICFWVHSSARWRRHSRSCISLATASTCCFQLVSKTIAVLLRILFVTRLLSLPPLFSR
jgi:hypothetical protein